MKIITKIFCLIICFGITDSCGKKSGLIYPGKSEKPDFTKEIE